MSVFKVAQGGAGVVECTSPDWKTSGHLSSGQHYPGREVLLFITGE